MTILAILMRCLCAPLALLLLVLGWLLHFIWPGFWLLYLLGLRLLGKKISI